MSNTRKSNIGKRRRLQELYVGGEEVRFGPDGVNKDPSPDDIVVWVCPPSPLQREQAVRDAQAERARMMLIAKKDPDSYPGAVTEELVTRMTLAEICEYISTLTEGERQQEATRNVLAMEEWEDIEALRDAMRQWEEAGSPTDDPEWEDLIARDGMFGEQVAEEMARIQDAEIESLKFLPREELNRRAIEKRLEMLGNQTFMEAYQNNLVWYSCRDPEDKRELFFESVEELRSCADEVQEGLLEAFARFIRDPGEAKNSQRAVDGSEQSAPPANPETSESSTPQA